MDVPARSTTTSPFALRLKTKPLTEGDIPSRCPTTLRNLLVRTCQLAVGIGRRADGQAQAAYLTNQATACLDAWRTDDISAAVAISVLERITRGL